MQINQAVNSMMILDHHKTAAAELEKIPSDLKIFDMNRSGVGITWDYFFPDSELPTFLKYVQDRDLWTHKYPDSPKFIAFFYEQEFNFKLWETFLDEKVVNNAMETGIIWMDYQKNVVSKIAKKMTAVIQEIDDIYRIVLYVNTPEFKSDVGNKAFEFYPYADFSCVTDYSIRKNETNFSLRSTNDRDDVSKIASKFGGGGHRNASGCVIPGLTATLSFNIVQNHGILSLISNKIVSSLKLNKLDEKYALFKVPEVKNEWLDPKYLDLIKRKCQECKYIIFQTNSTMVDVNSNTNEITPLNDYTLIFNQHCITNPEIKMAYMMCDFEEQCITFSSSRELSDILENFLDNKDGNTGT